MSRIRVVARALPFVLFMVVLAAILLWVLNQLATGADERDQQRSDIVALQSGLEEANARLEAQGEPPVDVPDVESGDDPPQIILGERGPAGVQGPQGRTGPPGETGPRGPIGPRGEPGTDGTDSTVPGPPGADGEPGADGVDGTNGTDGKDGADGRGIAKVECHTTGDWIITYTDGTAGTTPGPCRAEPAPTPTPTATTTKGR